MNKISENKIGFKKLWATINEGLNKSNNKTKITIKHENLIVEGDEKIADLTSDYFSNIGRNMADKIEKTDYIIGDTDIQCVNLLMNLIGEAELLKMCNRVNYNVE